MPDLRAKDGISLERCGVDTGLDLSAGAVKRADVGAEIRHCPRSSSPESTKSQHCAAPRRRKESLKTPGGPRAPAPAAQAPRSSSLRDAISEREREREKGTLAAPPARCSRWLQLHSFASISGSVVQLRIRPPLTTTQHTQHFLRLRTLPARPLGTLLYSANAPPACSS